MKCFLRYIPVLLILFILFSCDEEKGIKTELIKPTIELGEIIVNEKLGVSYQVPLNWNEMPVSISEKVVARVKKKGKDQFIIYVPKSFYYNSEDGSLLRVGQITYKDNTVADSLSLNIYSDLFKEYNKGLEIETTNIGNSNFQIKEMKIIKSNLMSFKYLFRNMNCEILQFDFSIKKNQYNMTYPTIKTSIESIKLL